MSHGMPWMCTAMIARVRGPIFGLDLPGVERVCPRIDVDEDRDPELLEDRLPRPGERERGGDDLVARPQVDAVQRGVDRRGAGVEEQAGRAADEGRPLRLEGRGFRRSDPAEHPAIEDGHHRGLVLWTDVGPRSLELLGDPGRLACFHV